MGASAIQTRASHKLYVKVWRKDRQGVRVYCQSDKCNVEQGAG